MYHFLKLHIYNETYIPSLCHPLSIECILRRGGSPFSLIIVIVAAAPPSEFRSEIMISAHESSLRQWAIYYSIAYVVALTSLVK